MIYNVTLCRQLIFEDTVSADSEEEAVEIALERNSYDDLDLNWCRNGLTQVVCVESAYDGLEHLRVLSADVEELSEAQEWMDDEEGMEWALD